MTRASSPSTRVSCAIETFPIAGRFVIARGAKTEAQVVVATISDGLATGRGECVPYARYGESVASVVAAIDGVRAALEQRPRRARLQDLLPPGAARNALDCALWDLEAKQSGVPVWRSAGLVRPAPAVTAFTISVGTPDEMAEAACKAAARPLLKVKLGGVGDRDRIAAVRRAAPKATLIVDANESWTGRDIAAEAAALVPYGVELIEQPVRAGDDHLLDGVISSITLCADESCQDRGDLSRCIGRYGAINIKLDKAGGLGEAMALASDARAAGMDIMVGCMLSTSLGVAPAFLLAAQARWVDLDGPLLLAKDRPGGFRFDGGLMHPASSGFWG